jgi:hypothetical protein
MRISSSISLMRTSADCGVIGIEIEIEFEKANDEAMELEIAVEIEIGTSGGVELPVG